MKSIQDYLRQPYARIVIPVENNGYHAEILEFPGCFAQGNTVDEAYAELEKAAQAWIETSLDNAQEIPEPSSSVTYSGRIVLRLPRGTHKRAAQLAHRDNTSLNTFLVSAVSQKIGAEDLYNVVTERLEARLAQAAFHGTYAAFSVLQTGLEQTIRPLPKIDKTASTAAASKGTVATSTGR
jgi:predicted RNase H-like HicB family nuclease